MAQQLRTLDALPEAQASVLNTPMAAHELSATLDQGIRQPLLASDTRHTCGEHKGMEANSYSHKIK